MIDFAAVVERQREYFRTGATRSREAREAALDCLRGFLVDREAEILAALADDLGKPAVEAYATEIMPVLAEIAHARRHLGRWLKPRRGAVPLLAMPARARVVREPFGVALVMGPWNYPLQLTLSPLAAALAAGNTAVLKPSEHAPRTAELIARGLRGIFDPRLVAVAEGGVETAVRVLDCRFDKIFFTGGTAAGRLVMAAAAKHLTPVTLELGGKCPAIVAGDLAGAGGKALRATARRIVWGKFLNAGQTCVAPDHVWVERGLHDALVAEMVAAVTEFFPDGKVGKIVNARHFERLTGLLGAGIVACGGGRDAASLRIEPTILTGVSPGSPLMAEEIFGPLLPVLAFDALDEVFEHLGGASPLAVYLFSRDRDVWRQVEAATRSGGLCINDTVVHITGQDLPFGGVGESGMGRYHGRAGFEAFTHERVVMSRSLTPDLGFRYPPHQLPLEKLKRILRLVNRA